MWPAANEIPFITAAEKLMELEVPPRALWIRLILTEMARMASHLIFMASYPLELGAQTPLFFALRERERVLDLLEGVTGGRFHPNFNRIGGVKPAYGSGSKTRKLVQDLPKTFYEETRRAMDEVLHACDQLEDLVAGNEIILARTKGIGVLPPEVAVAYGVTGPNLRASGVPFDLRKVENYLPYDQFDFQVITTQNGDCWDRWWCRLQEIRESAKIVQQAIDSIPSGPIQAKVPKVIKVPKGETYVRPRIPRAMGYYPSPKVDSPYRLKIRSRRSRTSRCCRGSSRVLVPTSSPSWARSLRSGRRGPMSLIADIMANFWLGLTKLLIGRCSCRDRHDRLRRDEALGEDAEPGRPLLRRRALGLGG